MKRRLFIQNLETRRLLAGDLNLACPADESDGQASLLAAATAGEAEQAGVPADDLVAFAKAIDAAGLQLFGAAWDPDTTQQRRLFEDGADYLSFVEVTGPDRTPNVFASLNNITVVPTWIRPDGTRLEGLQTLQQLADFASVAIPQGSTPSFQPIGDVDVKIGSPLHIPIDAYDPNGESLTVTVTVEQSDVLSANVLAGNRSIRMDMAGYGDMVYQLFEQRAQFASSRVIALAEDDFYNNIVFHRVIDEFVIQSGDPTGTGTGGSNLGEFDDDFHPDLQHNRSGVLSFAKAGDDTNDSQFFVTEAPTRHLDFNHSVIGQLVEGEPVREAISEHQVDSQDRPTQDITIDSIDVFEDTENAVIMLKAIAGTGSTNVTVTVTNESGDFVSETFAVNVINDDADSQPFLNPFDPPQAGPVRRSQTLQLTSIDVEGDEVSYVAQLVSPAGSAEVSVDDSGLVTVTPIGNFSGEVEAVVAVRRAFGGSSGDFDRQFVTFNFDAALTVPPLIDLSPSSDSGFDNLDHITNQSSLVFLVEDTADGDLIELLVDGQVGHSETATGMSTTITTDAISTRGEGTYSVSVRMTRGAEVLTGNTIDVVFDETEPRIDVTSFPSTVTVGQDLSALLTFQGSDVISTNGIGPEPDQIDLLLSAGPEGMTLDGATLQWSPIAQQLGPHAVRFRTTDAAGNTHVETFVVEVIPDAVAADPLVAIEISAADMDGNELSTFEVGQPFQVIFKATDLRIAAERDGIFSGYTDLLFDTTQNGPSSSASITHEGTFDVTPSGLVTLDGIDELGAANSDTTASMQPTSVIATIEMLGEVPDPFQFRPTRRRIPDMKSCCTAATNRFLLIKWNTEHLRSRLPHRGTESQIPRTSTATIRSAPEMRLR